ncbi:hypothetical protein DBR42_24830 [Pelomonas sp. HMWF004]|nr:hypothetical protein DBR42_24830 [Pelomonas sp. HMWF004]
MKPLLALTLAMSLASTTQAEAPTASDYAALSLPTAVLSAAMADATGLSAHTTPQAWLSTGAVLSLLAVHEEKGGFSWLLERPADGARFSMRIAGRLLDGVVLAPGAVVCITVASTGALLTTAGRLLAFIPNEAGKALLHHERVSG